jgi:hypothetical protein
MSLGPGIGPGESIIERMVIDMNEAQVCSLEQVEFGVTDDQALGVRVGVDLRAHLQSAARLGICDQLDDHLMTDQRATAPVQRPFFRFHKSSSEPVLFRCKK